MPARILLLLTIAFALVTGPACPLSLCGLMAKQQPSCGSCCPPEQSECCSAGEPAGGKVPLAVEPGSVAGKDLTEPVRIFLGLVPPTVPPEVSAQRAMIGRESGRAVLAMTCVRLI